MKFWSCKIPPKVLIFLRSLLQNRLQMCDQLQNSCVFCNEVVEDCHHLFYICHVNVISEIWRAIFSWLGIVFVMPHNIKQLYVPMRRCFVGRKAIRMNIFCGIYATCWCIWITINSIIFKNKSFTAMDLIAHIKVVSWNWMFYKRVIFLVQVLKRDIVWLCFFVLACCYIVHLVVLYRTVVIPLLLIISIYFSLLKKLDFYL